TAVRSSPEGTFCSCQAFAGALCQTMPLAPTTQQTPGAGDAVSENGVAAMATLSATPAGGAAAGGVAVAVLVIDAPVQVSPAFSLLSIRPTRNTRHRRAGFVGSDTIAIMPCARSAGVGVSTSRSFLAFASFFASFASYFAPPSAAPDSPSSARG